MDPVVELATVAASYLWAWREVFPHAEVFAVPAIRMGTAPRTDEITVAEQVRAAVQDDYAMLVRLRELTARAPIERWLPAPSAGAIKKVTADDASVASGTPAATPTTAPGDPPAATATPASGSTPATAPTRMGQSLRRRPDEGERENTDIEDVMRDVATRLESQRPGLVGTITRVTGWTFRTPDDLHKQTQLAMVVSYAGQMIELGALLGDVDLRRVPDDSAAAGRGGGAPLTREALTIHLARRFLTEGLLSRAAEVLDYRPMLLRLDPAVDATYLDDPNYPKLLLEYCRTHDEPIPFAFVEYEELAEIERSRVERYRHVPRTSSAKRSATETRGRSSGGSDEVASANDAEPAAAPHAAPALALASDRAAGMELLGVCLSGGGIRSATFNLGILQALALRGWLPRVDYLSTVSGGGYIGAWFLAWIKRRGSVLRVQESLRGSDGRAARHRRDPFQSPDPSDPHVRPIRFLREYSNYLAPTPGFFTADTWTMVSTWLRNTLLNLLVLAFSLMALLIAPRLSAYVMLSFASPFWPGAVAAGLLLSASVLIGLNLKSFGLANRATHVSTPARGDSTLVVAVTIVLPLFAAAFLATAALWIHPPAPALEGELQQQVRGFVWRPVFLLSAICCLIGLFLTVLVSNWNARTVRAVRRSDQDLKERLGAFWRAGGRTFVISGLPAAILGGVMALTVSQLLVPLLWEDTQRGVWLAVAFGPLTVLFGLAAVTVLYVGLEGIRFPDERREWWSRLGALIGLVGLAWALVACISFFAPLWVARLGLYANAAGVGWAAITAVGARLASSGRSNGANLALDKNAFSAALIKATPFIFVLGFLVLLSVGAHGLLGALQAKRFFVGPDFTVFEQPPFQLDRYVETYWALLEPRSPWPPIVAAVLCLLAALLARRVDVNEFSMHHFYRNRLVRAYLGASRSTRHRWPNAFTGFDLDDDIKLWRFRTTDPSVTNDASSDCRRGYVGPFPVINAALNTSSGDDLAWQERKARSFVFTPLYCGYDFSSRQTALPGRVRTQFAYRPTSNFGSVSGDPGLTIGTTIAISGAAANPNAGFHTSPAVAFLLTVFNARLGWWIGNPRSAKWSKSSPSFGLFYLLSELFGFANTSRKYVSLSDGGHFDNLGLYELIRRRCMYILVCDAEQDQTYSLQGLANAIRRSRVDFGVDIAWEEGDIAAVAPDSVARLSRSHLAVGRILYPGIAEQGRIIYLKSSITGRDEPPDVLEYRKRFPQFPHQSTGDQFFDESQFESYRALGQHVGEQLPRLRWPVGASGSEPLAKVFERCAARARMTRAAAPAADAPAAPDQGPRGGDE